MHAELALDDGSHARRGPMIVRKAERHGPVVIDLRYTIELVSRKPTGTSGSLAALKRIHTFICQRAIPPRSGRAADGKLSGDFRLREAVEEILRCLETSLFHLLTIQGDLSGYIH